MKGVSQLMKNYEKINEAMTRAKRDAEAGIVGYDKDGSLIIDTDLLDAKKQALIPIEVRMKERQEREMLLMIQLIPIMFPELQQSIQLILEDPNF